MEIAAKQVGRASAQDALSIWHDYKRCGDPRLRDRLIFMFMPMARHIVQRKARELPAHCDVEDLMSCGVEALIQSIDRYDPAKGATIEQYAWTRIQGAVIDGLRANDWAPRSLRRDEREINRARERLLAGAQRPTRGQLADAVGVSVTELAERLDRVALAEVGSLNRVVGSDPEGALEQIDLVESADRDSDPVASLERSEAKAHLRRAFAGLSDQEREIAVLLYVNEWTLRDIGERLGLSESRISQIHTKLRARLYEQLADHASLFAELI
jgi:RNA polymerase sigma factor for flagellar operon FliA